tara:strand:- start:53 stop:484 length:432 start_codon:yes stop_codon:yes gene_type:complete
MSRVVVNEIQAKVGNDVTFNSNIANPTTVKGEGTATTNLQQGLLKAWAQYDQDNDVLNDSFNMGSTTDVATSEYVLSFTSAMANDNYVASAMANRLYFVAFRDDQSEKTSDISTTSCKFKVNAYDAGAADQRYTGTLFAGDLA